LQITDIDLLIPHQANLRISQFIQKKFGLNDEQVFNNIQKFGNTTAASIRLRLPKPGRWVKSKKAIWWFWQLLEADSPGPARLSVGKMLYQKM
jgi:hypothetical protein